MSITAKIMALVKLLVIVVSVLSASMAVASVATYTYDELNRLKRVDYDDGTYISYSYDEIGNRLTTITNAISDNTPPTGEFVINGGADNTISTSVSLTLNCNDANGCVQMQFSNDGQNWSAVQAYSTIGTWTLTPGDGTKTVYARFKDSAGNWSTLYTYSIILDAVPPKEPLFTKVATGYFHTLALKSYGSLWAWGDNYRGILGDGTSMARKTPVRIGTDNDWVSMSAGEYHSIALKADGTLWAWGSSYNGALGYVPATPAESYTPARVGTDSNWTSIAAGGYHTVALKADGTLWAWGDNYFWQLGDGTMEDKYAPVRIGTDSNWASIAAGGYHTVALKADGTLWAWGPNYYGELGDGTTVTKSTPVRIGTDSNWVSITAGDYYTIALKSDGTLWAWGYNSRGALGDGTRAHKSTPVRIGTDSNWVSVAARGDHTVALKSDGTLWAWGENHLGQLGDGTTVDKIVPVRIGTDSNWTSIAAGYYHTVALKFDGTLWAWGSNSDGELGDGTRTSRISPIQVSTGVIRINNGAEYANNAQVSLGLSITDPTGVTEMQFSNDNVIWSPPETYVTTKMWTLTAGDGEKTVYAKFKDGAGNWSPGFTDTIMLDTAVPISTASPAEGIYNTSKMVTLTCNDGAGAGCSIYYTTNGTTPTTSSNYGSTIFVPSTTTLKFFAIDFAGNSEAVKTQTYTIDTTPPTGTVMINGGASHTNSQAVQLTLFCTDTDSVGCAAMQFSNDNVNWSAPESYAATRAWTLTTGDGTKTVYVKLKDAVGNWSTTYSDTIVLDTATPVTTTLPTGGTYNTTETVTLTCGDGVGSGCNKVYFTTDGTIPTTSSSVYSGAITFAATTTLKYFATDLAGNSEAVKTQTYTIDTTPPVTAASPAGGAYNANQSVALTCSDGAGAGCDKIYYTTDGATPTTASSIYSTPVVISTTTTLKFFAIDLAGNSDAVKTQTYSIDTTPPTGTVTINTGTSCTNTAAATLALSCNDAVGCDQMQFSNDNTSWSEPEAYATTKAWTMVAGDGNRTVSAKLKDTAGNWSTAISDTILLDTAPPATTASPVGGTFNATKSVTLACGDGPGAGCEKIYFTTDGTTPTTTSSVYSGAITIAATATVKFFATDLAGNSEVVKSQTYTIDMTPPVTAASLAEGAYNANQSVTLTCNDGSGAGCDKIYFTTDGTNPTTASSVYSTPVAISTSTTLKYFATDLAGNSETVKSQTYTMDTTSPTGSITVNSGAAYTTTANVTLGLSCTDSLACSQMQFNNDNTNWSSPEPYAATKAWTLATGDGNKTVHAKFKDGAGNWSAATSAGIMLDTTTPTTSASPTGGVYPSSRSVTLTCTDGAGSGCDKIFYTTDGSTPTTASNVYTAALSISATNTTTTVKFFAVDKAGNSETVRIQDYVIDTTTPTGTIAINAGAVATNNTSVTLTLTCTDNVSTCSQMKFSNDNITWSSPETFTATKAWALTTGQGRKYVYAKFMDTVGNWSSGPVVADITLDLTAPSTSISPPGGTYTGGQTVTLWCADLGGAFCDKIYYTTDGSTPTTASNVYVASLNISATTTLKYFSTDAAGNSESVKNETYTINPSDTTPPTGTMAVSGGANTKTPVVTLTLSCTDNSGTCSQMQFSNDNNTWSSPEVYATSKVWTLANGDGSKTVYAKFKDGGGNWSASISAGIVLDTMAPTTDASPAGGTYSSRSVTLTCTDGTGSGCDKIYYTTNGSTPTTLSSVYAAALNISTTTTLKYFATDKAGNSETVKTQAYTIDNTIPTGAITINSGTAFTNNNTNVMLTLTCTDNAGACSQMKFSNDNVTWSSPETYATTKTWALATGSGIKYVYAKFKDAVGNWSSFSNDSITVDLTPPTTSVSPSGGTYTGSRSVALWCNDGAGAGCDKIFYTTDGTTPTTSSSVCTTGSVTVSTTTTLKYFSTDLTGNSEAVKSQTYFIQ